MVFVIIVETRPEQNFIVYHIDYTPALITQHSKYMYFQDMLKSNIRYKISFFLQTLLDDDWEIVGQSQNRKSIFYTLKNDFNDPK